MGDLRTTGPIRRQEEEKVVGFNQLWFQEGALLSGSLWHE